MRTLEIFLVLTGAVFAAPVAILVVAVCAAYFG